MEAWYSLRLTEPPAVEASADKEAMKQLATPPPKWSLEADEQLARFLADRLNQQESNLGNVSQYVDSIEVSSVSTFRFICFSYLVRLILNFMVVTKMQFLIRGLLRFTIHVHNIVGSMGLLMECPLCIWTFHV